MTGGGNEGADASHFLYQLADDLNVTLDVVGPGVLYFARYNHWHGSPWHYETVTYGALFATLLPTDELKIGDAASERAHGYHSPQASEPHEITSRYEWGPEEGTFYLFLLPQTDADDAARKSRMSPFLDLGVLGPGL